MDRRRTRLIIGATVAAVVLMGGAAAAIYAGATDKPHAGDVQLTIVESSSHSPSPAPSVAESAAPSPSPALSSAKNAAPSPIAERVPSPNPTVPTPTQTSAPAKPGTLVTLAGSETTDTVKFTTGGDWTLEYSYDCGNLGMALNFIVFEYTDGQLSATSVNEIELSNSGKVTSHRKGEHYLQIVSYCEWKISVIG